MTTLAGSKRTAGTPFASPTKAAASAKRSRTQYDYYDEEDSESCPEDQWSPETDSGSDMSIDKNDERDSLGDESVAAPPRGPSPHLDSRDAEEMPTVRFTSPGLFSSVQTTDTQKELIHQRSVASWYYGHGSSKTKTKPCIGCACIKSGKQCDASSCRCKGGAACKNPLKNLDLVALFGQDSVAVHPCFTTWVSRQDKATLDRTNVHSLFDVLFEEDTYNFTLDDIYPYVNEPYLEWRAKWDRLCASERDGGAGLVLKQELLRWGLTARDHQSAYFSFCREDGWVQSELEWHCRICGECMEATHYTLGGCSCIHFPAPGTIMY